MNTNCSFNALEKMYDGEEADGFDLSTGNEWIYPINYPVRDYQKNIVSNALFKNTMVCLPTGLGKTFIAAVVMYNFHRWFPRHKVVFMAHSKPLVAQQVQACCKIMGIPSSVTAELNGTMSPAIRKNCWETKRIFFLTPQVFNNDLARGIVHPESIRCVVVDEAHKALGNQAYCQAVRSLRPFNNKFRVLALSATPGDDMKMVKSVIENLMISHLELRTEEDLDIKKYLHEKRVETIKVDLDSRILEYKKSLFQVLDKYMRQLVTSRAVNGVNLNSLSSFQMVLKQKQFLQNPTVGPEQSGLVLSNFSVCISLLRAVEELIIHGLRSFLNKLIVVQNGDGGNSKVHCRLAKDADFLALIESVENYIGKDCDVAFDPEKSLSHMNEKDIDQKGGPIVYSHPKFVILEDIVIGHFDSFKAKEESTRVIIFCKSRPCTGEICNFLHRFQPLVKPMILIGQSGGKGSHATSKGLNQASQLEVMRKFRSGDYNTLVATSVGEEGLDVGEVDLIVNFDSGRNSNTQVQRSGRTGRKRAGRVVNLVTEGKEYQDYNLSVSKAKLMNKKLLEGIKKLPLYPSNPRLIPKSVKPKCHEMHLKSQELVQPEETKVSRRSKRKSNETPKVVKKKKKSDVKTPKSQQKYDIRYALSHLKHKRSDSPDDSSDSLFESLEVIKKPTKEPKTTNSIELMCIDDSSGSVIETPVKYEKSEEVNDFTENLFDDNFIRELELLANIPTSGINCRNSENSILRKIPFLPSSSSSDDDGEETNNASINKINYCEPVLETEKKEEDAFDIWAEAEFFKSFEEPFVVDAENKPMRVSPPIEENQSTNSVADISNSGLDTQSSLLTVSQALNLVQNSNEKPRSPLKDLSPCNNQHKQTFNARKSLKFGLDTNNYYSSDEDMFAEIEEKIRISQKVKEDAVKTEKPTPKTAVVRPILKSETIPKSPEHTELINICTDVKTPIKNRSITLDTSPSMTNPWFLKQSQQANADCSKNGTSFDCIPDDLADFLDQSNLYNTSSTSIKNKIQPPSDDELSDGALEAIKAVEEFEKRERENSRKIAEAIKAVEKFEMKERQKLKNIEVRTEDMPSHFNNTKNTTFDLWDSDDSFAFKSGNSVRRKSSVKSSVKSPEVKKKKRLKRQKSNPFIEAEAEVSLTSLSSDEENTSELDELDSSFVDERSFCTQDPSVDMTAKYLRSVRSPRVPGKFKIPQKRSPAAYDVFSQYASNDEEYEHDSFCVDDDSEIVHKELSVLELAEMALEESNCHRERKKKRTTTNSAPKKTKKRRRIVTIDSSSDEDAPQRKKPSSIVNECEMKPVDSSELLILIGSRNIAIAPEITTCLRAKFKCRVEVRSAPGADFIVSWRMGINRVQMSDFCNCLSTSNKNFKESLTRGKELFEKFVIILEDDKNKGIPQTVGCHREMWNKRSARRLAKLVLNDFCVLFSRGKEETARIIHNLAVKECKKGYSVPGDWKNLPPSVEVRLNFYSSLPGVNVANAFRLGMKYSTIVSFLNASDSILAVKQNVAVSHDAAVQIFQTLFQTPKM